MIPRLSKTLPLTCLALALLLAPAAMADGLRTDDEGNAFGPELSALSSVTIDHAFPDPSCANLSYAVKVSHPAGTGDGLLDEIFAVEGKSLARAYDTPRAVLGADAPCPDERTDAGFIRTFEARAASPGVISVLYRDSQSSPAMAHPVNRVSAETWRLSPFRKASLSDIFPGDDGAAAKLWAEAAGLWCAQGHDRLPWLYGLSEEAGACPAKPGAPLPAAIAANPEDLSAWGNARPVPEGLAFTIAADDCWSHADGEGNMVVPKARLIELGASPAIWGE